MTIEELKNKKIGFISLGCDKNRVDLEYMIFNLSNFGFKIENNPEKANIIIINTCSFLESARMESIENILDMSRYKVNGCLEKLIVTGCINELNYPDLNDSLPEVDAFINIKDNNSIVNIIARLYNIKCNYSYVNDRTMTTPQHYAFLKIAEGCNNFCTYCLIPYIRGRFRSQPIEELVDEARRLASRGVKEIILVAQDVTKYGEDIYGEKRLVQLIKEISKITEIKWIRLLYCYPEEIGDDLINEIKTNNKVLKYLDIPLQHVSTRILKAMNRRSSYESVCQLFDNLKSKIPDITIRTTFILGFPGENQEDVDLIEDFLIKYKLNNVGFFKYSREEGTNAFKLENQINEDIKEMRLQQLSQTQYDVLMNLNQQYINNTYDAIVDESYADYSICRFYGQAPMIDSIIIVEHPLPIGEIVKIKIIGTNDYDFKGEIL